MPDAFRFDEITWPEVAALPRETELVLPLGSVPDSGIIASMLKATQTVGILPSHPVRLGR